MSTGVPGVVLFLFDFLLSLWHVSNVYSRVILLFESPRCVKGVFPLRVMNTDMMWKSPFNTEVTRVVPFFSNHLQLLWSVSHTQPGPHNLQEELPPSRCAHLRVGIIPPSRHKLQSYLSINIKLNYNLLSYWNKGVHTKFIINIEMWQQSNVQQLTFEWHNMPTLIVPTQELLGKTLAQ